MFPEFVLICPLLDPIGMGFGLQFNSYFALVPKSKV